MVTILLTGAFLSLGGALHLREGLYTLLALVLVTLGFLFVCIAAWVTLRHRGGEREKLPAVTLLAIALTIELLIGALKAPGLHVAVPAYTTIVRAVQIVLAAGFLLLLVPAMGRTRMITTVTFVAVVAALVLRVAMPVVSPHPVIDVHVVEQQGASSLLRRENPYLARVRSPYGSPEEMGYVMDTYAYPPGNLYIQTLGYFATGDVRNAHILLELLFVVTLWLLAGRDTCGLLLGALFLWMPRGLLVIEQGWTEPLLLGFFGLSILLWRTGRFRAAAAAYGYFLSLKQYLLWFAVQWLLLERRWHVLLFGVAAAAATVIPFVLWDSESLLLKGLLFQLNTGFHPDTLSIAAPLSRYVGWQPGALWTAAVGGITTVMTGWVFRTLKPFHRYLWSITLTTYAMFLFGSQAFANYYYFVCGLIVLLLCSTWSERMRT